MIPFPDLLAHPTVIGAAIKARGDIFLVALIGLWLALILVWLIRLNRSRPRVMLLFAVPSRGQMLPVGTHFIRLHFSRGIDREGSSLKLIGPRRESVELAIGSLSALNVISAQMQLRCPGEYALRWKVLSADGVRDTGTVPFSARLIF